MRYTWIVPARSLMRGGAAALSVLLAGVRGFLAWVARAGVSFRSTFILLDHRRPLLYFAMSAQRRRRIRPGSAAADGTPSPPGGPGRLRRCGAAWLGARTFFQATYWSNSITLFEHTIAVNPRSGLATPTSGWRTSVASIRGRLQALPEGRSRSPDDRTSAPTTARRWPTSGDSTRAEAEYRAALAIDPDTSRPGREWRNWPLCAS